MAVALMHPYCFTRHELLEVRQQTELFSRQWSSFSQYLNWFNLV